MLSPRRTKYRRQHRGRRRGYSKGEQQVTHGDFGIKALEPAWITSRQIEAARVAMTRKIRRGGKVWINLYPDKPVTQKPPRPGWDRARAHLSSGLPLSSRGE